MPCSYQNPSDQKRHLGFQAPNPMTQTEFEKSASVREQAERFVARVTYESGIQGRDGGYPIKPLLPEI